MEFKNRENKKYTTTCGETIWHSRNVATCVCMVRTNPEDNTKIQVLGVKRGSAVTNSGKYCFPCGYLDWDENIPEAAQREVFEEAGLKIDWKELSLVQLDSNPEKSSQNVTAHFLHYYNGDQEPSAKNAAENEVDEVRWIDLVEAEKLDWAFDHKERIETLIKNSAIG
jgi:8-oxo-dGTP pyrophosphatase MutT (NUDIX family)